MSSVTNFNSSKFTKPLDLNDIEMVFGKPSSPKSSRPDIHLTINEKLNDKTVNKTREGDPETTQSQPLLEPDREPQKPPLAGPEIDDLDDDYHTDTTASFPGIDDGLLEPDNSKTPFPGIDDGLLEPDKNKTPNVPSEGDGEKHEGDEKNPFDPALDDGTGTEDGKWPLVPGDDVDGPYGGIDGFSTRFGGDDRPMTPPPPGSVLDVNTYQQKKNLAQGMMDLALLSANANQLRYVLESSGTHPYYYPSLTFISLSIIIQIAVGVGLIMNSQYNVTEEPHMRKADNSNNIIVLGVFLITIVNVFITSFAVAPPVVSTTGGVVIQQAG